MQEKGRQELINSSHRRCQTNQVQGLLRAFIILLGMYGLTSYPAPATEESLESGPHQHHFRPCLFHPVSPEMVEIQKKLTFLNARYPKLVQSPPEIESKEAFQLAKHYLALLTDYGDILLNEYMASVRMVTLNKQHQVCKQAVIYIEALLGSTYTNYRSEKDTEELEHAYYRTNCILAEDYLTFLQSPRLPDADPLSPQVQQYFVSQIKNIKKTLASSSKYRKILQEQIEQAQTQDPNLIQLFDPTRRKAQQKPRRISKKIEGRRELTALEKSYDIILKDGALDDSLKGSFDGYYDISTYNMVREYVMLRSKPLTYDKYVATIHKLTNDYIAFEKTLNKFRVELLQLNLPPDTPSLDFNHLMNIYNFVAHRFYYEPQKYSTGFSLLQHMIDLFIAANQPAEALLRTEVLREFILRERDLPEDFIYFRASLLSLNGNPSEWLFIRQQKRQEEKQRKANKHKKHLSQIKTSLSTAPTKEGEVKTSESLSPKAAQKVRSGPVGTPDYELTASSCVNYKSEFVRPREKIKIKTRGQEVVTQTIAVQPSLTSERLLPARDYYLSKKAFKTYKNIRAGEWKFSRNDLYHLFIKLGCTIDMTQGKGDHHKVSIPLQMTIEKEGHLITVLPEFRSEQVSMLTIPNWDHKWDGRVPPYLTKSIIAALDVLGATDEIVHKGNIKE